MVDNLTCLPNLTNKHATVQSLSCSQGPCPEARTHTHTRTEPQQRYYIPIATRCAGIMSDDGGFLISEKVYMMYIDMNTIPILQR